MAPNEYEIEAEFEETEVELDDEFGTIYQIQGPKGEKGDPGYTPVKGTDYWTPADKAEMVSDVIAALPIYNGEAVDV